MSDISNEPGLPFDLSAAPPEAWKVGNDAGSIVGTAAALTDFYVNPGGADSGDAASTMNAATLLGTPPAGDFTFSARITVDFRATYDAGVLMLWIDEANWAKFCFEYSPDAEPMVVSVVTRGLSDDANAFVVPSTTVWLRVARIDGSYAFHASTDGTRWTFVRVFSMGDVSPVHRIGFEVQSPTGDGCTVTFDEIAFASRRLGDLRDGS